MTDESARTATEHRWDGYKPVPDDLLTVLDRLVDAAEDVIAWCNLRESDFFIECEFRRSINRLGYAIEKAVTSLGETS